MDIIERDLNRTFPDNINFKPDIMMKKNTPVEADSSSIDSFVSLESMYSDGKVESPIAPEPTCYIIAMRRILTGLNSIYLI